MNIQKEYYNMKKSFYEKFQTVTACPCWVELRLNKPLGILDAALKELQPLEKGIESMT